MKKIPEISSTQNPLVKQILELQSKSRERNKQQKFIVEGLNELRLCLNAGYNLETLIFSDANISFAELETFLGGDINNLEIVHVSAKVFEKIAYRKDVKNALAIVSMKTGLFSDVPLHGKSLVLVAEGIEKPGNLGAVLRSADAMGVDGVLLADPKCDIYNPNVIRGSVGCVFTIPIFSSGNAVILEFLKKNSFRIFTTFMDSASLSWDAKFEGRTAIVVGTESSGLSEFWRNPEHTNVNIPMLGKVDSLNVSVAVSILLYEAVRQLKMQ